MDLVGGLILAIPLIVMYFICILIKNAKDRLVEVLDRYKHKRAVNEHYRNKSKVKDVYQVRNFLRSINDREFEYFCANLWSISKGYKATLTQKSRDGGKDVILRDNEFNIGYIECKHYAENNNVGVGVTQRLMGAMTDDGADFGILMTTGKVTTEAWKRSDKITIMNMDDIVRFVGNMSKNDFKELIYNTKNKIVI